MQTSDHHAMTMLQRAALGRDVHLHAALDVVGVERPADLDEVRTWLRTSDTTLHAVRDAAGRCTIAIRRASCAVAWIRPNGAVITATAARAALAQAILQPELV